MKTIISAAAMRGSVALSSPDEQMTFAIVLEIVQGTHCPPYMESKAPVTCNSHVFAIVLWRHCFSEAYGYNVICGSGAVVAYRLFHLLRFAIAI